MGAPGSLAILRRVLANRALRRVLFGYLAFHIAEFGTWVAILLYAYAETGPASVGVVALIQLVPAAIIAAPAATLGDRYPRERVLTAGYLFQAGAMAATAAAMIGGFPVWAVYTIAAVAASSLVVTRPTQSALLPSLSDTPDELTAANGAAGVVEGIGVLIGPLIAAAVLTTSTSGVVFAIAAVALVIAAVSTLGLRPRNGLGVMTGHPASTDDADDAGRADRLDHVDPSFLAGLRTIIGDADARLVVGIMTVRMVIIGAADVLFVLMALDLLGMGEPGAGILNAALGAGTIAGGALTFALIGRAGLSWITLVGAFLWGICLALVGATAQAVLAPVLIVVGGAGLTIVDVAGRTMLQRSIRDEVLARVFGLQEGLAMIGLGIGSILVAAIVGFVDLSGAILVSAALLPVSVLLAWARLAALDRRGVVPAQAIALLRATSLFAPLAPPELEAVARRGTWLTYPGETIVIREGDPGDRYFVISFGAVRVEQEGRFLRTLDRPGSGFGEIALLREVPRTATVTTTGPVVVLAIDRAPFLAAVTGHPGAFAAAQKTVDRHVGRADAAIE